MNFAVFLADGFEEVEALTPVDYLRRAGADVTLVSALSADKDPLLVTGSHKVRVLADAALSDFLDMDFVPDGIFFPGGMPGSLNLASNERLLEFAKRAFAEGKLVSAICAAPVVVLGKAGILDGRSYTCYPGMEKDYPPKDAVRHDAPFVTDGNLVTGRGAGAAEEFAMELVRILCGEDAAKRVHDATCQR